MIYNIKKNKHYSKHFPKLYFGKKEINFDFIFDTSSKYVFTDIDKFDVNKLFGFSFGYHHNNSIRIGWLWNESKNYFEIYYYIYNNKIRFMKLISTCKLYEKINIDIVNNFKDNIVEITFLNKTILKPVIIEHFEFEYPKFKLGYYLFPYFGGNKVSPNNMNIDLTLN